MKKYKKVIEGTALTLAIVLVSTIIFMWVLKRYHLEGVLVLGIFCVAAFWGWIIRWLYKDGRITFSHILVIWLVASGTIMGATSYFLAYCGITDTLETLSRYVMVETVAGSAGYFLKSALENNTIIKTSSCTSDTTTTTTTTDSNIKRDM
jgi:hypothetical protein